MRKEFLEIGKILGVHGINGEIKVGYWCDSPEVFCKIKYLYLNEGKECLNVKSRPHKNIILTKISEVDSLDAANKYLGAILYAKRSDISLDQNAHFIQDLIGLDVLDIDTEFKYGTIRDVLKTGANDVYCVTNESNKEWLIPVIPDIVKSIDIDEGIVLIKPIEGLFT